MVEETTTASHALRQSVDELSGLIGGFQVDEARPGYGVCFIDVALAERPGPARDGLGWAGAAGYSPASGLA